MIFRAIALSLLPLPAFACAMEQPFLPTDLARAPVVMAATVTGYYQQDDYDGILTVTVQDLLKGAAPATVTMTWEPDLSEWPPAQWNRDVHILLGAVPPQDGRPWQLAVEVCGQAWILPDTDENRVILAATIREQS